MRVYSLSLQLEIIREVLELCWWCTLVDPKQKIGSGNPEVLLCLLCLWFKRNHIHTLEWTGSGKELGGLNSSRISIEKNSEWSRN